MAASASASTDPVEALNTAVERKTDDTPPSPAMQAALAALRSHARVSGASIPTADRAYWCSDHALCRFIVARKGDVDAAAGMYAATMAFRSEKACAALYTFPADLSRASGVDRGYSEPAVMRHFFPWGMIGYDREGFPLLMERVGMIDLVGMHAAVGTDAFLTWVQWYHEVQESIMRRASVRAGADRHKMTCIIDCSGMSLRLLTSATLSVLKSRVRLEEDNYPEVVKRVFLINTPSLFATVWGIIKMFMDEGTVDKMHILGTNFLPTLSKYVDVPALPVSLGGALKDVNGDGACFALVGPGGLVHTAYAVGIPNDFKGNGQEVHVPAGKHEDVTLRVPAGATVSWAWGMTEKDITFSVSSAPAAVGAAPPAVLDVTVTVAGVHQLQAGYKPHVGFGPQVVTAADAGKLDGPLLGAVPASPVRMQVEAARGEKGRGSVTITEASIVRFRWDNSHSWMTGKTLARRIDVCMAGETLDSPGARIEVHDLERVAAQRYAFLETFAVT